MSKYIDFQELAALVLFADDDKQPFDIDAVRRLNALQAAVERNVLRHLEGARKRNAMLQEKIDSIREKDRVRIKTEGYPETLPVLDSFEVAQGLLYQLQQLKTYKLSRTKVILILYEMYCTWLGKNKERLFDEHPVATEYGPQFWGVFKRLNTGAPVPYSQWKSLCERNSGVAAFCKNAAAKYYDKNNSTLEETFKKSAPYKNASKENNFGKWNKEISDKNIFEWKNAK